MTKQLETLPEDIDRLFHEGKELDDENLALFLTNIANLLQDSLKPKIDEPPTIRMSKLGIPDRKLWFEHNVFLKKEPTSNSLKFIYGHIIEQLIIFLAKEAGHEVTEEQREVEIDGIKGHIDCKIDGTLVDIKSASSYAFRKFSERQLFKDDPFGYIAQLSAYKSATESKDASFIGVNKESGQICLLPLEGAEEINPNKRIARVKEVVTLPEPPAEKCYQPVSYKGSENLTLHKNCTYCVFKDLCWKDANNGQGLRYFQYAQEVVPLVKVVSTPRVPEIVKTDDAAE